MEEEKFISPMRSIHMVPMDVIAGFEVRPGMYELNGAMAIPVGVNFTVHSFGATSCELLLFTGKKKSRMRCCRFRNIIGSGMYIP